MSGADPGGLFAEDECEDLLVGLVDDTDHISGGEDSESDGVSDDYDDEGFGEEHDNEGPLKKTKPPLHWSHQEVVLGWMTVATILHFRVEDGPDIVSRGGYFTTHDVLYRFQCAFANRLFCEWQLEVRIPFDQKTVTRQYQRVHPDCHDSAFDTIVYDNQTMSVVSVATRPLVHARHVCFIKIANPHTLHPHYQPSSSHCLWVAHCNTVMYSSAVVPRYSSVWFRRKLIENT